MSVSVLIGTGIRLLGDFCISRADFQKKIKEIKKRYKDKKIIEKYKNDTIYYIMSFHTETFGIATSIRAVLSNIKYALDNNWIPIVDMQSTPNPYLNQDEVGKLNAWEFYFVQPLQASLNDIKGKKNVIYADQAQHEICPTDSMEFYSNQFSVDYWRKLYKKYIVLNKKTSEFICRQYEILFGDSKVLGCICRGTDYVERRAYKHPIQPKTEELINEAKVLIEKREYEKIFLATEDERILKEFKNAFGSKLIYVEQQRYNDGKIPLALQDSFAKKTSRKEEGLKYVTAIYLLGKCNAIIGGRCGMSTISYLISDGYEYTHLWNLGRYGIDDYCLPEEYLG